MNARRRGLEVTLTEELFQNWYASQPKACCYCGVPECELASRKNTGLTIDRKDNSIGYTLNNVCIACFRCNNMKSDFFTHEAWSRIAEEFIKPRLSEFHKTLKTRNV